ncbi:MAG: ribbon-helix-helix domain-containing protein [Rhodospirillaceae bacterium]|jgi:predicted DNA-binding ribbon-helix-helix protein|nr:ribbon-helix-helix domain-containing protein [Rhodospirillaceae bacterium]
MQRAFAMQDGEGALDFSPVRKSLRIHGHSTTIRLEAAFWQVLEEVAETEECSVPVLITQINHHCPVDRNNMASCLRVFCLTYVIGQKSE